MTMSQSNNEIIANHICRFNDAPQVCDCFVAGLTAKDSRLEEIKEELKEGIGHGRFGFSNEKGEICIKISDVLALFDNKN